MRQREPSKLEIDRFGVITSRGKFLGQPQYAPYFWTQVKQGLSDARERGAYIFDITDKDRTEFPELTNYDIIRISEDRRGFITAEAEYE